MAEIGTAVVSTLIERVVDAIIGRARCLFYFKKSVVDLRKSKRELEKSLQHMRERVKEATTNAEKIVQPVEEWLKDVERVLEDVQGLEERVEESECCLNMTFKYSLAKEVICMTLQMNVVNNNNKFEPFSHPIKLSSMNYFFPKDFVAFDSRKPVYEELLQAIQDERSNVIGVVGVEGSGKSTLARVVGKQVEESKVFDKVVMTIVSQDVKLRDIQGQIADHLSFSLVEETELGRALRLSHRLKTEKILIIFDGVWQKLDLEAIGIPLNENDKRCCVLLTTRDQEVCTSMNCHTMIELSVLDEDEGWDLFKQRAQIDDDSPEEMREVAKRVFDKCEGLLVDILAVARTLKGKTFTSWELALFRVETSESIDVQKGLNSTYECNELEEIICLDWKDAGQLRYLYAPSQPVFPKLKKILIKGCIKLTKIFFPSMVSSLPELRELSVQDCNELVEIVSSEEARQLANLSFQSQQVSFPKLWVIEIERCNKLKSIFFATIVSSLSELTQLSIRNCNNLEVIISSDSEETKKHRNVNAPFSQFFPKLGRISIENCNKLKTFFSAITVTSLPMLQQLIVKDCNTWEEIISLDSDQAGQFRNLYTLYNQEDCFPKLGSVQIERCNSLKTIFSMEFVSTLPELLELTVKDCDEWVKIMSLGLKQAKQAGNLSAHSKQICFTKLQKIEIESCKRLRTVFFTNVVRSLPELEQIVVKNCDEWEGIVSSDSEEERQYRFLSASSQEVCFPKLRKIEIEKCNKLKAIFSTTIVTSLPELEQLIVKDCDEFEEIISLDSDEAGGLKNSYAPSQQVFFPKLGSISIERCSKIKRMFYMVIVSILPMLEQLVVKDCNEWEEIISLDSVEASELTNVSAPSHHICFPRLRKIEIEGCNRLKAIFSSTTVTRLPMLEQLFVKNCSGCEDIISLDSKEASQCTNQLAPFQQVCFPKLMKIVIECCNKLKAIFFTTLVTRLPRLEHLSIDNCNELEEIVSLDSVEISQLRNLCDPSQQSFFPVLQRILINRCNKLKKIFSAKIVTTLPELVHVWINNCNEWEEIISSDSEESSKQGNLSAASQQVFFPKLESLYIEKCNKMKTIFCATVVTSLPKLRRLNVKGCNEWETIISFGSKKVGQNKNFLNPCQSKCFPKLQSIWVEECNKLKTIFFLSIVSRLPNLESLFVDNCNNLEAIISPYSMEATQSRNLSGRPNQVRFPKLGSIVIRRCSKMKNLFSTITLSRFPKLKQLFVLDCNELEDIISSEAKPLRNLSTSSQQIYFPTLQNIQIERCNKLKTIFSFIIVRSLPELECVSVEDCNELKEIFFFGSEEEGQVENISDPSQHVCLPKVRSIKIKTCNKLKFIFPYSVACQCSSLNLLDVESCPQLAQIVKFEHEGTSEEEGSGVAIDDNHAKHLLFPNLSSLELKKLPTITGTFPWYEPQNCHLIIQECPKYLWFT
ncbi:probable disease resistance protein At1g61180 [Vigna unguiculata]|uniref:probable disease resistance protein At1g61180 n=1 Tax=Vigna unguiculata TaxID=3917 RepID=UPI001016DBA9|nr:probable disease resistance protein At1g61180 [Vigna unguiculata]